VSPGAGACVNQVKRECERGFVPRKAAAPATVTGEGIRQATGPKGLGKAGSPTGRPGIRKPGDLPAQMT